MNTTRTSLCYLFGLIVGAASSIWGQDPSEAHSTADVGQFFPVLSQYATDQPQSFSWLSKPWQDREQWRIAARAKLHQLLAYQPAAASLNARVIWQTDKGAYTQYLCRYAVARDRTTEAYLLVPNGLNKPAPAVVAIHDHGGFYYYGKEKITATDHPPQILKEFIQRSYGGRTYADELARRGFVVLIPDGFYFGSQRLDVDQVDDRFAQQVRTLDPGSDDYIRAFNRFASGHETLMAKTIFTSGSTWPGLLFQGDRASVDFLCTRPEVDRSRIGCIGLSIGGFRSAHLTGLDPRIKAAVVAGWMTTYESLLKHHLRNHTWMIYVPGQLQYLDLPDVATLNAPRPLMVINCLQDRLFTLRGMRAAEQKISAVYQAMQATDRFVCKYYDVPHSLNVEMQDDAIAFLESWLKDSTPAKSLLK